MNWIEIIISCILIIIGSCFIIISAKKILKKFKILNSQIFNNSWREYYADVLINEIDFKMSMGSRVYGLRIEYSYNFKGKKYYSKSRFLDDEAYSSNKKNKLREFIRNNKIGSKVKIFLNSNKPQESYIVQSKFREFSHSLLLCGLLVFGLFIFLGGLYYFQYFEFHNQIKSLLTTTFKYGWLVFGILFSIILLFIIPKSINNLTKNTNSKLWNSVSGKVLKSELHKYREHNRNNYTVDFVYEYKVNNQIFINDGRYFHPEIRRNYKRKKDLEFIKKYPVNTEIEVFYNQLAPEESVLLRTKPTRYIILSAIYLIGLSISMVVIINQLKEIF